MRSTKADQRRHGKHCLRIQYLRMQLVLFSVAALLLVDPAIADDAKVHRCIGSNGEPSFSDKPCTTTAAPTALDIAPGSSLNVRPTTQTCPTSADDLKQRIGTAFATRNAVGLSGLFLWEGHTGGSSTAALRDMANLVREPLIAIDLDEGEAQHSPSASVSIRTTREMDRVPREAVTRYESHMRQGCWWLMLPP